ncbi:MAG TPA: trigger factor [Patescibacteria group bacterium]
MQLTIEKLQNSRMKIIVKAPAADLAHAAEHALHHLSAQVAVKGFRPGKAPKPMIVAQLGKGRILSELVDHALPELLEEVVRKEKISLIEAPSYTLEKLCELNDDGTVKEDSTLEFTAEADYAPDVKVGDYTKIKIKPAKVAEVTDTEIDSVLTDLAERRATYDTVERAAKEGDRVEIDFAGKRNGIPEDRLASKHYPIVIGSKTMIPGFEDQLIGKKAGDAFSFEITFPKDYHAKDMAGEKVVFEVTVHEVHERKLPEINDDFAKEFEQESLDTLKAAIRQEREYSFGEEAKQADEAATLEEFLKLVEVDVPQSLVEREIDRQVEALKQQAAQFGLNFEQYLQHMKKTEEEIRKEMRESAEKAVKIGLGLGEVVEREGLEKDKNAGYVAIEKLVEIATAKTASKKK